SMSLNKVMIIGRLGREPELKYTQSGSPVCTFSVATDESYTDNSGQKVEKAEWHRIVVFQKAAENCSQYLAKGSLVFIEGRLETRKWQDQQGQDRFATEIRRSASSSSTASGRVQPAQEGGRGSRSTPRLPHRL
ncbi:MAG: single-stranded DNA-binding protein, partial [Bilophila wadsworthia]